MTDRTPFWRRDLRFWGADPVADIDDEFRFHIEMRVEELVARGMSPAEARDEVMRGFGNLEHVKRTCRTLAEDHEQMRQRSEWLSGWRQDIRQGVRQLTVSPVLSVVLIVTLALGIGATVAIFSVTYAVLLRPLPYAGADRMVMVFETLRTRRGSASVGHFHDWTEQGTVFEATAAMQNATVNLTDEGEPERVGGARVTPGYFRVADIPPALGRYFTARDVENDARVTVLSHGLWQRRFGGDPTIIGRAIRVGGEPHRVIGVAAAAHTMTELMPQLWMPLVFSPEQRSNYGSHSFRVMALLKPGVTRDQAQKDMERVTRGIAERNPRAMEGRSVNVEPYETVLFGNSRTSLYVILVAVAFVMLIGCVNVASLLLARATTRRKEMAIRAAIGGGRSRIVRQLLTESLVLATVGGIAALGVAYLGVRLFLSADLPNQPRLQDAGLDLEVLLFALTVTLVAGVLVGLAPALRATHTDLRGVLQDSGALALSASRDRLRGTLVVAEIAIAVVLLVGAGLFVRSGLRLQEVPFGFRTDHLLVAWLTLSPDRYANPPAVTAAYRRLLDDVRAIPGVEAAGASTSIPLRPNSVGVGLIAEGRTVSGPQPDVQIRIVTDGYLEAAGIPLRRGRLLLASDMTPAAAPVVVVNERVASLMWPGESPLGKRVSGWAAGPEPEWREVVGVVGDVRTFGQDTPVAPEYFVPYSHAPATSWDMFQRSMGLVLKTTEDPSIYAAPLRRVVADLDRSLPLFDVRTMEELTTESTAAEDFRTLLLSLLAGIGLVLAGVGIYGVIAYFVTQRTPEIGLRLALGATTGSVLAMVLRHSARLVLVGTVAGIIAALAATRVMSSLLFEITPSDPITYALCALGLLTVAIAAIVAPAWRATHVDPVRSLTGT